MEKVTKNITVTWCAFGEPTSINFTIKTIYADEPTCERIYAATNLYSGSMWNIIEPLLSKNRTHTALSVGDEITINDKTYVCADFGFIPKEEAVYDTINRDGRQIIFGVSRKESA